MSFVISLLRPQNLEQNLSFVQHLTTGEIKTYTPEQWCPPNTRNTNNKPNRKEMRDHQCYLYLPSRIAYGIQQNALFAYNGRIGRYQMNQPRPPGWDQDLLGPYQPGNRLTSLPLSHIVHLSQHVLPTALINYKQTTYIIGSTATPSPLCIKTHSRGSMGKIDRLLREYSFDKFWFDETQEPVPQELIDSVVGQINPDILVETFEDGRQMVWAPRETIQWGHLFFAEQRLSLSDAKQLISQQRNVIFKTIQEQFNGQAWIGQPLHQEEFNTLAQQKLDAKWIEQYNDRHKDKTLHEATWEHVRMLARVSPDTLNCYGFKGLQIGQPIYFCKHCKQHNIFSVGRCLGRRLTDTKDHRDISTISGKICGKQNVLQAPELMSIRIFQGE